MVNSSENKTGNVTKAAGISNPTASRVRQSKSARDRAPQGVQASGYPPLTQAQRTYKGRLRKIAVLFSPSYLGNRPYNVLERDFILGASTAVPEEEFLFSLLITPITKQNLLNLYWTTQVDGLVLMHIHTQDWRVELLRNSGYPFVMMGRCTDNTGLPYIDLDFEESVVTAFNYLIGLGHRHIGFLSLPAEMRQRKYGPAVRAWAGYMRICGLHNFPVVYREVSFSLDEIYTATLELFDEDPDLTAIVTTHDFAFPSITQALKAQHKRIPDDCSLIAVMPEKMAELGVPPITYIDFPTYNMGHRAAEMLIRLLGGADDQPEQVVIPPRLVVRETTRPVK